MMLSVVPFYVSAEAVALTTANVVTWPTTSGEIYFGQKLSDGIILHTENALVTSDGTATGAVIPGEWKFADYDFAPTTAGTTARFTIVFTPDDQNAYTGFERANGREVTCVVNKVTPVFVDEINDPIVATDVEQGAKLSTSTVSGGQMKNPYTNEIINKSWKWSSGSTIVNSTGEYKANFAGGSGYNKVEAMVMVKVIGDMQATEIIPPEAVTVEYSPSTKYGDISLAGVKAVIKGTTTEVPGEFSTTWADAKIIGVGTYNIPIVFTPDDTENYIASEGTMSVTVTKANYKFVDENGEAIVPEITLSYGTTLKNVDSKLRAFIADRANLTGADVVGTFNYGEGIDKEAILPTGTKEYTVIVEPSGDGNYAATELKFELTIEPTPMEVKSSGNSSNNIRILTVATKDAYAPAPLGTFAIYVDGTLLKEGLKVGETAEWLPEKSGAYELKVVYTPVENDPCVVETFTQTGKVNMIRTLTRVKSLPDGTTTVTYGEEVNLTANVLEENFGGWRITDANGNEVDLGIDTTSSKITFTMPDYDITVEAIDKSESSSDGGLDIDNIFGDLTEGDSDNAILNIFNNIIAWFKNIIETIKGFFRSIGDLT